jgi:nucleoid DNA-binding protein
VNTRELVREIAKDAHITQGEARKALGGIALVMRDALAKGEEIAIKGFGKFHVETGRKPDPVVFEPSEVLAERIVGGK